MAALAALFAAAPTLMLSFATPIGCADPRGGQAGVSDTVFVVGFTIAAVLAWTFVGALVRVCAGRPWVRRRVWPASVVVAVVLSVGHLSAVGAADPGPGAPITERCRGLSMS